MRFQILGVVALVIFTIFVTVFAASADSRGMRVLPKWLWVLACLFVPFFGGMAYLLVGRPLTPPSKPLAPDDDPEFLRKLRERLEDDE